MHRQHLKTYKGLVVTPDAAEALLALERRANDVGKWRVRFLPPSASKADPLSLVSAGREVQLVFEKSGCTAQDALNAAWGCAIPLGFTPKLRYPLPEPGYTTYHFFGIWQGLGGRLLAEGRGHLVWPSICCAAQVDVGEWQGDKEEARFIQAQLHRLERNCGPVDGVIGPRTALAIESLALPRGALAQVAEYLRTAATPVVRTKAVGRGHFLVPGYEIVAEGCGGIKVWPMQHGASLEILGPGRLVVDIR